MDRFTLFTRIATGLGVAFIFAVASTTVGPAALDGQGTDPCVEEWEDELDSPCVDLEHRDPWDGQCGGWSCYTALEMCCLPEIVVR